ncbi:hypothetical protein IGB42_04170 [Andreprevotia sp. IGB-42]|nr:hypothetical protein IGB42_04170 [Andreprevotia sp. IGB-42]
MAGCAAALLSFQICVSHSHYAQVMGLDSVAGAPAHKPAVEVSWLDALAFCKVLSRLAGLQECCSPDGEGSMLCDW